MALNINIRDVYRTGEPVVFWATLDPPDPPIGLPSSNPYQIRREEKIVYQPTAIGGSLQLTSNTPTKWEWNQQDQFGKQVIHGKYELAFFAAQQKDCAFEISNSWAKVMKSASKWCGRAAKWGGLGAAFFEPLIGATLAFISVPFEWIEKDPPSTGFETLEIIPEMKIDFTSVADEARYKIMDAIALTDYLILIHKTLEKMAGAFEAGQMEFAKMQETHLEYSVSQIAKVARSLSSSLSSLEHKENASTHDAVHILEREFRSPLSKIMIEHFTKHAPSFESDLHAMLARAGHEKLHLPANSQLQLELSRFANSLAAPPVVAQAA